MVERSQSEINSEVQAQVQNLIELRDELKLTTEEFKNFAENAVAHLSQLSAGESEVRHNHEDLRREIERLRTELVALRSGLRGAVDDLGDRIARLNSQRE